jgi:hypothetical protein
MVDDVFSWHPVVTGYCLQGTRGCFEFDRAAIVEDGKLSAWKDLDQLEREFGLSSFRDSGGHSSAWAMCLRTFLDAIDKDREPPQNLSDALHITAIGWAANESLMTGKPVVVRQFEGV